MTFVETVENMKASPCAPGEWWGRTHGGPWQWVRVRAGRHVPGLFAESPHDSRLHSLGLFQWDASVDPLPYPRGCES